MAAVAAWVTAQAATSGIQAMMVSALLLLTHPAELPYLLRWTFQTGRRRPVFSILAKSTNCNTWAAPASPSSPALPIPASDLHNLCPQSSAARGRATSKPSDPSHSRKFIFTQKGPALQTTIRYADGTEKQCIYRRKEDMAAELMTMFQEELRVYPPWSKDRRKRYEYERQ